MEKYEKNKFLVLDFNEKQGEKKCPTSGCYL
jgi:hypothetical protein